MLAAFTLLAAAAAPASLPCAAAPARPAITQSTPGRGASPHGPFQGKLLVIDLDDVGFDLLRDTPTPTLDALERDGRFFTNFTTASICTPTRAMLHTGAFPSHPDLLLGEIVPPGSPFAMPIAPLTTLGTLIQSGGYTTAKVGKWHLAGSAFPAHPQQAGWQGYAGSFSNVQQFGQGYTNYPKTVNGITAQVTGTYLTTDETDDAIRCVNADIDLVSVSYHAPHKPWHIPPADLFTVDPILNDRDRARAMLQACDSEMRRLLNAALPLGYTVIVFADNGTAQPIGGFKGTFKELGIVNPMWAFGPSITPGVDESRVGVVDLYATIANLFGMPAGQTSGFPDRGPNSRSFVHALHGFPVFRRFTYADRFRNLGDDPRLFPLTRWRRVLRGERYKLSIADADATEIKLVDYVNDPDESINLLDPPGGLSGEAGLFHRFARYVFTIL